MTKICLVKSYEHALQTGCVLWFNLQYSEYSGLLFAVPNGGYRSKRTAMKIREEGGVSGVADLILMIPSGTYCALCLEMKVGKNKQSERQKLWEQQVVSMGYGYRVVRTFEEFQELVERYLGNGTL